MPALLAAIAALDNTDVDLAACFHLDSCTDGSAALLRAAADTLPFAIHVTQGPWADANAGRARRAALAMGLAYLGGGDGLLLTTDADSRPQADWVRTARHALAIADVAAGRIVRGAARADAIQSRLERYNDRLHRYRRAIDPVPWEGEGHHFSGGANLAVRASVYVALGGFRPIASAEDATLLDDAARAGFRVRRDAAMIVETSSRRHGRAPGGLAAALREIDAAGLPDVPHPAAAAWQYQAQAEARRAFAAIAAGPVRARLGRSIGLTGDHVLGVARDCPNAEAFAMRIVPVAPGQQPYVPLAEAEAALADLERGLCERAA